MPAGYDSPGLGAPLVVVRQFVSANLPVDFSTVLVDPAFALLVSLPFTPAGASRRVRILFTMSGRGSALFLFVALLRINGVAVAGAANLTAGRGALAISWHATLPAGLSTIAIEIAKGAGVPAIDVLSILALTAPGEDHAAIEIEEFDP